MGKYNYVKTNWIGGKTVGTADVMNNLEEGVFQAHEKLENVSSQLEQNMNKINEQFNTIAKKEEGIVNALKLGLQQNLEYINKSYESTGTILDGKTRQFVNNQTDYAKNNVNKLQEILNTNRRVYIPKGDYVFCDYDETTKESITITVPDNTEIFGDGEGLTRLYGIRFRGSTSNLYVHDIDFKGITDITPSGKLKQNGTENFNNEVDFDYKKYNLLLKRPDINYNTPLIFSPSFENKEISNIKISNCNFYNVTNGCIIGDHLGLNVNNYDSKNIEMTNCYGNNLIYHLMATQRSINVKSYGNTLEKSYIGMVLDCNRKSKNVVFTNNIAKKCCNLAKLEVSLIDGTSSENEVMSNNVFESWTTTDLHYNTDYVMKLTGNGIVDNNIIEINSKFDDVFSLTQTVNNSKHIITNNLVKINCSDKARHSVCNAIFRLYSYVNDITNYELIADNNKINVTDENSSVLRLLDAKSTSENNFKPSLTLTQNKINKVSECCFIDGVDLKVLTFNNNQIEFNEGYYNVITLLELGSSLEQLIIKNNNIKFSRGCLLNANYFSGVITKSNKDIEIVIENNIYKSKYLTSEFETKYTESTKTQFIHLSNFVDKIKTFRIKNNYINAHEFILYTTLNTTINTLIMKENLIEFLGTRTGVTSIFYSSPVTFGVITNNDFIKKSYTVEIEGNNKIIWNNNNGASGITVKNVLAS